MRPGSRCGHSKYKPAALKSPAQDTGRSVAPGNPPCHRALFQNHCCGRNLDPSRYFCGDGSVDGKAVGGHGDRAGLRDSAGGGDWPRAVAVGEPSGGSDRCNNAALGHRIGRCRRSFRTGKLAGAIGGRRPLHRMSHWTTAAFGVRLEALDSCGGALPLPQLDPSRCCGWGLFLSARPYFTRSLSSPPTPAARMMLYQSPIFI